MTEWSEAAGMLRMIVADILIPFAILSTLCGAFLLLYSRFLPLQFFLLIWKILSGAMDHKKIKNGYTHAGAFFKESLVGSLPGAAIGALLARSIQPEGTLLLIWLSIPLAMALRFTYVTLALALRSSEAGQPGQLKLIARGLHMPWASAVYGGLHVLYSILLIAIIFVALVSRGTDASALKGALALSFFLLIVAAAHNRLRRWLFSSSVLAVIISVCAFAWLAFQSSFIENIQQFRISLLPVRLSSRPALDAALLALGAYFVYSELPGTAIHESIRTEYAAKAGMASMTGPLLSGLVATLCFLIPDSFLSWNFFHIAGNAGFVLLAALLALVFLAAAAWMRNAFRITMKPDSLRISVQILFFSALVLSSIFVINLLNLKEWLLLSGALGAALAFPALVATVMLAPFAKRQTLSFLEKGHARYEIARDTYLFLWTVLPKNLLSRLFGWIAFLRLPRFIMLPLLQAFARAYRINLDEAELELKDYPSLNKFFTRALRDGARVIDKSESAFISPVDARILQFGQIGGGAMMQAKGTHYTLHDLLEGSSFIESFVEGEFIILYLSPQDYHRIHTPAYGRILGYTYSPGSLFMVNQLAVRGIQGLFPKNERLTTYMQTEYGLLAVVKVGATNVGKISVTYDQITTNRWIRRPVHNTYEKSILYGRGQELGRFEMGSTVILLFEKGMVSFFPELLPDQKVSFGQKLGRFLKKKQAIS